MQENIRQDNIVGSRRFGNYFWGAFLVLGGISFLLPDFQVISKSIYYHLLTQQN